MSANDTDTANSSLINTPRKSKKLKIRLKIKDTDNSDEVVTTHENSGVKLFDNDVSDIKPKMNAFQLLMDSRHKVIGLNSDGKDATEINHSDADVDEKKKVCLKRKKYLEEWAESKGSMESKLKEKSREEYVHEVLDRRAKRLKKMLESPSTKTVSDDSSRKIRKKKLKLKTNKSTSSIKDNDLKSVSKNELVDKEKIETEMSLNSSSIITSSTVRNNDSESFKNEEKNDNIIVKQSKFSDCKSQNTITDSFVFNSKSYPQVEDETFNTDTKIFSPGKQTKLLNYFNTSPIKEENILLNTMIVSVDIHESPKTRNIKNKTVKIHPSKNVILKEDNISKDFDLCDDNEESTIIKVNVQYKKKTPKKSENPDEMVSTKKNHLRLQKRHLKIKNSIDQESEEKAQVSIKSKIDNFVEDDVLNKKIKTKKNKSNKSKNTKKTIENIDEISKNVESDNSSDYIFSPKKKTIKLKDENSDSEGTIDIINDDSVDLINDLEKSSKVIVPKPRLAPLFIKKVNVVSKKAKEEFLRSGVPSSLQKYLEKSKSIEKNEYKIFPTISHVLQKPDTGEIDILWNLSNVNTFKLKSVPILRTQFDLLTFGAITNCNLSENEIPKINIKSTLSITTEDYKNYVSKIKSENPEFPVFKIFKSLYHRKGDISDKKLSRNEKNKKLKMTKRSKRRSKTSNTICDDSHIKSVDLLTWTEKYKPQSSDDIVGNIYCMKELKKWLQSWIEYSQDVNRNKMQRHTSNSSDDFIVSDSDSKDSQWVPKNTMVLVGPNGSGKTSTVYALANELNVNILEINASSRRTGKRILTELLEATQSHRVNNKHANNGCYENLNDYFNNDSNAEKNDKNKFKLSLMLFEDIDIVFEEDESFISGVNTLISSSKRPVILTSSDPDSYIVQKFASQHSVITFSSLSSKILGTWLQLVCLLEGLNVNKESLVELLDWNKGDIRKTLLQLQFWGKSGGDYFDNKSKLKHLDILPSRRVSSDKNVFDEDESSNLSWLISDNSVKNISIQEHTRCIDTFLQMAEKSLTLTLPCPVNLGNLWWNMTTILNTNDKSDHKCKLQELKAICCLFDDIATADVVYQLNNINSNDFEPSFQSRQATISDSLSLKEDLRYYSRSAELTTDLTHYSIQSSVVIVKNLINKNFNDRLTLAAPHPDDFRWRKKQQILNDNLLNCIPWPSHLGNKSISMDYQSALRNICRAEVDRSTSNTKRGNRFYHYLRSLNVACDEKSMNDICSIFQK